THHALRTILYSLDWKNMTRYFLGIDTGATKSHALIADESGQALGFATGGTGNPEIVGYDGLAEVLRDITGRALALAGISTAAIAGAGFGIAGYDWPSQRQVTLESIQALGLSAPLEIVNDALLGLLAGASAGWGVAVVAGTSCNCWGWDRQRRIGRMTGFGAWMGEAAGSSELIGKALQAVALEWTQRGPATRLTPALVEWAGARDLADLLEGLSQNRYRLSAAAAPLVFQVAAEGDPVALDLIRWAGRELGSMAVGVIRQLQFETLAFEVVLAGSFYNGSQLLRETMAETIHAVAPGAQLVRLTVPPVVGGIVLGMEQAGLDPLPVRERLIQSTQALLQAEEPSSPAADITYDKAALIKRQVSSPATSGQANLANPNVLDDEDMKRVDQQSIELASTEILTPLTSIVGYTELLINTSNLLNDNQKEWLKLIHSNAGYLIKFFSDLLKK
ncbi:MAG TPA: BadF/BadG/BcrA/BcrD ATPase family protein, partial [Anaerolineae bacterium]|nr:BadF/BadG/BcrA/BcrD ATPase family protein [Anaerolineae bacterium]